MASFYSSNYYQDYDNYQYSQSYNYGSREPRYVQYYDHTEYYGNAYQQAPAQSLVGYYNSAYNNYNHPEFLSSKNEDFYGKNGDYYEPVTTQFIVSYSTNGGAANDLDFEEYNPEPFKGGYDIDEAYGKALPPSDDICYPPTKMIDPVIVPPSLGDSSVLAPYGNKEAKNREGEAKPGNGIVGSKVIEVGSEIDSEEDEDYDDDDDLEEEEDDEEDGEGDKEQGIVQNVEGESNPTNVNIVSQVIQEQNESKSEEEEDDEDDEYEENVGDLGDDQARNEGGNGEIRRQIPAGYGVEAMDLCEGLFGGYFPCLLKKDKGRCDQGGCRENRDEYDCWQGTVDYLFGNPNPYGGAMPERGSYGDPVYCYRRHYPQQSIRGQVQYGEDGSPWLHASRYYNGQ